MSQAEIRELMHLTKVPANDATLLHYYQFNEPNGVAFDKISQKDGVLRGAATRSTSTAPIGDGVSNTIAVTTGGTKKFTSTDCEITFPATGTFPDGDVVFSKINVAPDQAAGSSPVPGNTYWVVHNYGANTNFSTLENIKFSDLTGIVANSPAFYNLFKRASNADGNTWGTAIDAADLATATALTFSTGNGITNFSQFTIDGNAPALAIEQISFGVELVNDKEVDVLWKTTGEVNNAYFVVEWSSDSRGFQEIGKVNSKGNNDEDVNAYHFLHNSPQRGSNYYRLKLVDNDEKIQYSEIKNIVLEALSTEFVVYPNPLTDKNTLNIKTVTTETYLFSVYNAKGVRVYKGVFSGDAIVNLKDLSKGFYAYRIELKNKLVNGKEIDYRLKPINRYNLNGWLLK